MTPFRGNTRKTYPKRIRTPEILQSETTECGAVALSSVLAAFGRHVPLEEIRARCSVSRDGSRANTMLHAAATYGLRGYGLSLEIDELLQRRPPLILHWEFNHFIVYEGTDGRIAWINDPSSGRHAVKIDELRKKFTGIALVFESVDGRMPRHANRVVASHISSTWRQVASRFRYELTLLLVFGLLSGLGMVLFSYFLRVATDAGGALAVKSGIGMALVLAMLGLVRGGLAAASTATSSALGIRSGSSVADALVDRLLRMPIEFFDRRIPAELVARAEIPERLAKTAAAFGGKLTLCVGSLPVLLLALFASRFDFAVWATTIILLAAIIAVLPALVNRTQWQCHRRRQNAILGMTQDMGNHIETTRLRGTGRRAFARWIDHFAEFGGTGVSADTLGIRFRLAADVFGALAFALLLYYGISLAIGGEITLGTLLAIQALSFFALSMMSDTVKAAVKMSEILGDSQRMLDLARAASEADGRPEPTIRPDDVPPFFCLRNIVYGYGHRSEPLLRDLSLDLAVGTILGISGRSGAGKSTVAKIAAGLIMPWKGDAFLRGESIFQKDPCSAGIAYVAQGATLLGDTVADHVRMGRNELGDEDIEKAIVAAKADFVFERDKGLAAPIERNGSNFSGGERERIELARALAGNPKLLILDEATQSMDSHVEKEIVDYLRLRGMTVMIIAQRLDTLLACDQIVMIETGNASRPMTPDEFGNVVARSVCEEAS